MTESQTVGHDTTALVRAAQAGDTAAMTDLITGHLSLIYNIVGRALSGHPDVDDLVQDTMLRAIRGLPSLRAPDRFRSWLVTIAYRQIHLHLRSRRTALLRTHPQPVDVPDPGGDLAERAVSELVLTGQRRELDAATRWLDDDDRRLLSLWWQEVAGTLTRTELAAALTVRPEHAAVRVQRMKARLDIARGIVRALRARPRCTGLAALIGGHSGAADPLWRKRLTRHVRECPHCERHGQGLVEPERLLLGVSALPVPAAVLAGVQGLLELKVAAPAAAAGHGILAAVQDFFQNKIIATVTAASVAAGGGLVYAVHQTPLTPPDEPAIAAPTAATRTLEPTARGTPRPASSPTPVPSAPAPAGAGVSRADIFVAPDGSDDGDGSVRRPYATLGKAVATVRPGQTIALRGGTYRPAEPVTISTSGTAAKRITLSNYRDERPVIDAAAVPADKWAVTQQASYWTVQGLELKNSRSHAYVCRGCHANVFRRLFLHDNARSGLMLRDPGTTGNQVLNNDFSANRDPGGAAGTGIGLGVAFGAGTGNLVRGNRAFGNAAAGFDFGSFASPVTVEYNWSFRNGGSGFTFGGGTPPVAAAHRIRHNAAWNNTGHGFSDEGNRAALELGNNTAFRNGATGFFLPDAAAVLRGNAALDNGSAVTVGAGAKQSRNTWQPGVEAPLRSTDATTAEGPRTGAGGLPPSDYLTTGNGIGASMNGA